MDTNGLILIPAVVYFLPSGLILILAVIYFIPSIVASVRNHRQLAAIFRLNIFLGWTFIGWVAALIWAMER
jgi:Superinfection immunity protein